MGGARSFIDLIVATARQKFAAAKARRDPDTAAEKPRDAILDALHMIHDAIATDGYTFAPSGPKFVRKSGDFSFEIHIQSDRNNIAGKKATIWVHVSIYSKSLTIWRKQHPSEWIRPKAPIPLPLFTTQLGYLCRPARWRQWDFAKPARRRAIVDNLIAAIQKGAYPLFSTFEGPIERIASLTDRDGPSPEGILSYLLSCGHRALADKLLDRYLRRRPAFRKQFVSLSRQFAEQGLPPHRAGIAHDLAAFAVATDYPWDRTGIAVR